MTHEGIQEEATNCEALVIKGEVSNFEVSENFTSESNLHLLVSDTDRDWLTKILQSRVIQSGEQIGSKTDEERG